MAFLLQPFAKVSGSGEGIEVIRSVREVIPPDILDGLEHPEKTTPGGIVAPWGVAYGKIRGVGVENDRNKKRWKIGGEFFPFSLLQGGDLATAGRLLAKFGVTVEAGAQQVAAKQAADEAELRRQAQLRQDFENLPPVLWSAMEKARRDAQFRGPFGKSAEFPRGLRVEFQAQYRKWVLGGDAETDGEYVYEAEPGAALAIWRDFEAALEYEATPKAMDSLSDEQIRGNLETARWIAENMPENALAEFAVRLGMRPDLTGSELREAVRVYLGILANNAGVDLRVLFAEVNAYMDQGGSVQGSAGGNFLKQLFKSVKKLVTHPKKWLRSLGEEFGKGVRNFGREILRARKNVPFLGKFFLDPLTISGHAAAIEQLGVALVEQNARAFDERKVVGLTAASLQEAGKGALAASAFIPQPFGAIVAAAGALSLAAGNAMERYMNQAEAARESEKLAKEVEAQKKAAAEAAANDPYVYTEIFYPVPYEKFQTAFLPQEDGGYLPVWVELPSIGWALLVYDPAQGVGAQTDGGFVLLAREAA